MNKNKENVKQNKKCEERNFWFIISQRSFDVHNFDENKKEEKDKTDHSISIQFMSEE